MPAISEILDSVNVPSLIKDNLIKNGTFEKTSKGLRYYSGGFTVVFPVSVKGEKWAFRCWHSELGNVRKRFKKISDYINDLKSPYFCDFYYCDEGIVVEGKTYPTTRMKWVEGETINKYIENHIFESDTLKSLASSFISMIEYLHEKKIAHGDLQHGNIIVKDGEIRLVDYDSLFVPGLNGNSDIIKGKADFQHPKRKDISFASEKLDYFSELVIYLSILSISIRPELIKEFSIDDSLLFRASDWEDFTNSKIYHALISINNDDIKLLLSILINYLKENNINNFRPFPEVWRDLVKVPVIHSLKCNNDKGIVYKNEYTEINWDVENCSKALINGEEINPNLSAKNLRFSKDSIVELIAQNGLHTVSESIKIHVVDKPTISITSSKQKLRKTKHGIEDAILSWNVNNAESVVVKCDNKVVSKQKSATDFRINPQNDVTYTIVATGLDGHAKFSKSVTIIIREPSYIELNSDKTFTPPGVPVTISWNVKNAKEVKLNDQDVPSIGKTVIFPKTDTQYILSVEDEFELKKEQIEIRMLPLPLIKTVLVNTPDIDKTVGIQYNSPQFEDVPQIPTVKTQFTYLDVPQINNPKEGNLFINLPELQSEKLTNRITKFIKQSLKNLF